MTTILAMQKFLLLALLSALLPSVAKAQEPPLLSLPLDCTPEIDCWVMQYVDMDAAINEFKDPHCGARTYDAHKGTDFALRDYAAMEKGVDVLAAADGTVLRLRDGEEDSWKSEAEIQAVQDSQKECGNGILIDHGNGYQSMYCHLKKGSIIVKPDQEVKRGEKLAQVGLSGMTEYPHLHYGIHFEGKVIDPFTAHNVSEGCGESFETLWESGLNLSYQPTALYNFGFFDQAPQLAEIDKGNHKLKTLTTAAQAFTFWAVLFGIEEGDEVTLEIKNPDGTLFSKRTFISPKTRTRQFYFIGKETKNTPLHPGIYVASATLKRAGNNTENILYTIEDSIKITGE